MINRIKRLDDQIIKTYFVYILASSKNGSLYTGETNNLLRRVIEHKKGLLEGFSKKYYVKMFVYYEQTSDIRIAIHREKQIKKWNRNWNIKLIEKNNPEWNDLFYEIGGNDEMLADDFQLYLK